MNVGFDIFGRKLDGRAVAAAKSGESCIVEHLAAVGEIHAAMAARFGCSIARVNAGFGGDEVGARDVTDRGRLVVANPRERLDLHMRKTLHRRDKGKLVAVDFAGSLEWAARNVDALHDAGLDGIG